ncbi:hypothetical protein [Oceanobacillus massiliensis]|uniref:hypothetical protein n=1 Tax=Oceanobacillus massiliensis TaxID=1465765 RepID=UPI0012B5DDBE|nr:hypothetical protein [Oceanobacillus massiliensis]
MYISLNESSARRFVLIRRLKSWPAENDRLEWNQTKLFIEHISLNLDLNKR